MPVTLPPTCRGVDLDPAAPPRFCQVEIEPEYGAIVHCRPPFECRRWPIKLPIPPRWVEIPAGEHDNLTRPLPPKPPAEWSCRVAVLRDPAPRGLERPVGAISPRPPRVRPRTRARRPPRRPRPPRPPRDPRGPRPPRKPRRPREPRTRRDTRTISKLVPSWHGWTVQVLLILPPPYINTPPLPCVGPRCIIDYNDNMTAWHDRLAEFKTDAEIRDYLSKQGNCAQCRAGAERSQCSIIVGEIANVLDTLTQMTHGPTTYKPTTPEQLARATRGKFLGTVFPPPEEPAAPPTPTPTPPPGAPGFVIWQPINVASIVTPSGAGGRIQTSIAFYSSGQIPAPGYFVASISPTDPGLPSWG